jgi:hypothetical protein
MLVVIDRGARPKEDGPRHTPNMETPILENPALNVIPRLTRLTP